MTRSRPASERADSRPVRSIRTETENGTGAGFGPTTAVMMIVAAILLVVVPKLPTAEVARSPSPSNAVYRLTTELPRVETRQDAGICRAHAEGRSDGRGRATVTGSFSTYAPVAMYARVGGDANLAQCQPTTSAMPSRPVGR